MAMERGSSGPDRAMQTESVDGAARLQQYLNARVMVYYNSQSSYTDTGRVTYLDAHWLEMTKDNGERLLMPTLAVRIVKMLEPVRQSNDADTLLRPLDSPPPSDEKVIPK